MYITIGQYIDAVEKNGLPQQIGQMLSFDLDNQKPIAGCAIGQAAVNLGFDPYGTLPNVPPDQGATNVCEHNLVPTDLFYITAHLNDKHRLKLDEIAESLRGLFSSKLNKKMKVAKRTF